MKSIAVRLYVRVVFALPASAANGRLRPQIAMVDGQARHCPDGTYHLRYAHNGRRVWENVGTDPQLALLARERKQRAFEAVAVGFVVSDEGRRQKTALAEAVASYLDDVRLTNLPKTVITYRETLRGFNAISGRKFLEVLDRRDVFAYMMTLRERGNTPQTIHNRLVFLRTFFRAHGTTLPISKGDWSSFTEKAVSCYRPDELHALLAAGNQDEQDMVNIFLCTGGRKQEVQFAAWSDIDWTLKTLTIREKLDLGFRPKDREEGSIPLPDYLIDVLRETRARHPKTRLIFELPGGKTEEHFLRVIKRLALRAGLNCGDCWTKAGKCCASHPVCKRIILHKIRKTFATMHHESGVSARTIQRWLRHSDLDTTLRYLAASDDHSERTRQAVNGRFAKLAGESGGPAFAGPPLSNRPASFEPIGYVNWLELIAIAHLQAAILPSRTQSHKVSRVTPRMAMTSFEVRRVSRRCRRSRIEGEQGASRASGAKAASPGMGSNTARLLAIYIMCCTIRCFEENRCRYPGCAHWQRRSILGTVYSYRLPCLTLSPLLG